MPQDTDVSAVFIPGTARSATVHAPYLRWFPVLSAACRRLRRDLESKEARRIPEVPMKRGCYSLVYCWRRWSPPRILRPFPQGRP